MVMRLRTYRSRRRLPKRQVAATAAPPPQSVDTQWAPLLISYLLEIVENLLEVADCLDLIFSNTWLQPSDV